ncbi:MAG: hypothetical protein ACXIU7_13970 [Roseinatronobacter sp.]
MAKFKRNCAHAGLSAAQRHENTAICRHEHGPEKQATFRPEFRQRNYGNKFPVDVALFRQSGQFFGVAQKKPEFE